MNRYYTRRLHDFLIELSRNNNREWFQQHKAEYQELRAYWLDDLQRLIDAMSAWEPRLKAVTPAKTAYRIYRDTRFSPDKTPYKIYFSASFSPRGTKMEHYPGYYLHMDARPGESALYGGIWQPEAPVLRKLRHAIVDNIEEFSDIVNTPAMLAYYPGWEGERLKTAPKGWPKDHPDIELLKLKDYGKMHVTPAEFFYDPSWPEKAAEIFSYLKPLVDFLEYSIDE